MPFEFKDAKVKRMNITELKPAEYNPRTITDKAFHGLGKSIENFGLLVPIVWNEVTGNIVGGHQRYRYLIEQGVTETDVVVVNLNHHEEVALNITLNNKEVRGQFTEDAVEALRTTEAKIGSLFKDLGLIDLHDAIAKKIKKDKTTLTGQTHLDDAPPPEPMPKASNCGPVALISCPKCGSRWRMKDNVVVHDATKNGGKRG